MSDFRGRVALLAGWFVLAASPVSGQGCVDDPEFGALDFWVGEWNVSVGEQHVGTNRIEKILEGCAILEHWVAADGGEGKSLFYHQPATGEWKQVWVTTTPDRPGGVKEKTLVERLPDGGLRFQGEIPVPGGGKYLDRTTLTPAGDGTIHQVIEHSTDDGETWQVGFDALYTPAKPSE